MLQETKIRQSKREVGEADSARRILITDSQLFTEKMTLQENVKLERAMGVDLHHHDQKHEVGLGWNQEDKGKIKQGKGGIMCMYHLASSKDHPQCSVLYTTPLASSFHQL